MKKSDKFKKFLSCMVFLLVLLHLFLSVTYLFRNSDGNRKRIVGLESEEDIDVIYIGASTVYMYWQPLRAWKDCGFTSYNFATGSIQAESIEYYIREARKTQSPKLYIIGLRSFQRWLEDVQEAALRYGSDSMDFFSPNRWKMINTYLENRVVPDDEDIISYYFDIAKYHSNTEVLADPENWSYIRNNGASSDKGFELANVYGYLEKPLDFMTDERAELPEGAEKTLVQLLQYCKSEELNVLFVVCPYEINREDQEKYNTMKDIIEQYDYKYLNANEYYNEMNIDFSTDFFNASHVNVFGAEKYTVFLENFLVDNYDLPDHRGNPDYENWDSALESFLKQENNYKRMTTNRKLAYEREVAAADELVQTEDVAQWQILASESYFTLLIVQKGICGQPDRMVDKDILDNWQLTDLNAVNSIRILEGESVLVSNKGGSFTRYEAAEEVEEDEEWTCLIDNTDEIASIMINGKEYSRQEEGINIVVVDNIRNVVVDSVTIKCMDGKLELIR